MKVITCASYYGSGSSALTDLVSEYSDVCSLTDYEFRFLHDLDGVMDLEYHLCDYHNRHNSGHALKRFIKLSKFNSGNKFSKRYEPFFNNNYMKITEHYVEKLVDFSFNGWWFYDLYDKGALAYYIYQLSDKIIKRVTSNKLRILPKEVTLCSHPSRERFISCTQEYVHKLLCEANKNELPFVLVDQMVPSQNISRVYRYFKDELFVVVVDRDPRDVYTLSKFYWFDKVSPYNDVNDFCDWYEYIRTSGSQEDIIKGHVINIHFEDLIFNYNKVTKEIEEFTGLSNTNHNNQFKFFNPKRSVNNTRVWEKHSIDNDIKVIECRLKKYLYDYSEIDYNRVTGPEEEDKKIF